MNLLIAMASGRTHPQQQHHQHHQHQRCHLTQLGS
jgi:hypothetical protein